MRYINIILFVLAISSNTLCFGSTQAHINFDKCVMNYSCYIQDNKALARCYSVTQRYYGTMVKNVEFPEYVTVSGTDYKVIEIGDQACDADRIDGLQLLNIHLPNTIERIGKAAFRNCFCKSIHFPAQLKSIDEYAFQRSHLTFVEIPEGIQHIGSGAFQESHIDTVIINNSINIKQDVFSKNSNLKTIIYTNSKAPDDWVAVSNTYVPDLIEYSSPTSSIGIYNVREMISWKQDTFDYNGNKPVPIYINNVDGYTVSLDFSRLHTRAGVWCDTIVASFKDILNGHDFVTKIPFHYTIKPVTLKVTANNATRIYGEDNPTFSMSYIGFIKGENENVLTTKPVSCTTATKTSEVGKYSITISGGNANNYTFVYEPGTLTITKAPLSARINDTTRQYGTDNPSFTISYTGLKNGETSPKWKEALKVSTSATKRSDVGTYIIKAAGTPTNYNLSSIDDGTLTITQAPLKIKAINVSREYFEDEPNFDYTCTGFLNDDDKNVLTKAPKIKTEATKTSNAGKYKLTPIGAEAKNYLISYELGELNITKRQLKASSHCTRQYGDENPILPIEYFGFVNNEDENVLTSKPVATTKAVKTSLVGNYPITVSGGMAANYEFVYEQGTLIVSKASLSAKVSDVKKVYGEENPNFGIEYYGLKNGETVPAWATKPIFQTEATKKSGVGQYVVTAVNGDAINYNLKMADGTLSITPAPLLLKANNASRQYFENNPEFDFSCNGFRNGDDIEVLDKIPTIKTDASIKSNVGRYQITPSSAEAKNYTISYEPGELTITKRHLKATSHSSRLYGEENPTFPIEYVGFVNNETEEVLEEKPIGSSTATKTSIVGTYPIIIKGGNATNYEFIYEPGVLTVIKAPLSAKVSDTTKVYGDQNPNFTIEYSGLKNSETTPAWTTRPTFQTEATKASGVGKYIVSAVNGVAMNYDLNIADGILNIKPAPLTIQANDVSRPYFNDNPTFSYVCSGFVNGDTETALATKPTLSTSATKTSNVGRYEIKATGATSQNYSVSCVSGVLNITPLTLTASVGNYEREYNESNPKFVVKYDGFVNNEGEQVIKTKAIATTAATQTSDVGTYPINVSGGIADNYIFTYKSGTLTINKAEQSLAWNQDLSLLGVGDQIELIAKASSGLPVSYSIDNDDIAEVYSANSKIYLDCKEKGNFQIVAVQEGNKNYFPSSRIRKTLVIGDVSGIAGVEESSINILATNNGIKVTGTNVGDIIRIYSMDGILLKSVKAETKTTDISLENHMVYIIHAGGKTLKLSR